MLHKNQSLLLFLKTLSSLVATFCHLLITFANSLDLDQA